MFVSIGTRISLPNYSHQLVPMPSISFKDSLNSIHTFDYPQKKHFKAHCSTKFAMNISNNLALFK